MIATENEKRKAKPRASMESVRKKVLTLLADRSTFMAAFGGAMPTEDSHLRSASYGPAGMVREGTEFSHLDGEQFEKLVRSMHELNKALRKLYNRDRQAYLMLVLPYLGDPGDPNVVGKWRERRDMVVRGRIFTIRHDRAVANHDLAIEILTEILRDKELFADYPKRTASTNQASVDQRNDQLYGTYKSLRSEGKSKTKSVKEAALLCEYTERRAWQIVGLREEYDTPA